MNFDTDSSNIDTNTTAVQDKLKDFSLFATVLVLIDYIERKAQQGDDPIELVDDIMSAWKCRQDTAFEEELEALDDINNITGLFQKLAGESLSKETLRASHNRLIDFVVTNMTETLLKTFGEHEEDH